MDPITISAIAAASAAGFGGVALLLRLLLGEWNLLTALRRRKAKQPENIGDDDIRSITPTTATALHQLPRPSDDFTGREVEKAELLAQIEGGGVAISGLRGMGGIGKTALALVLAHELAPRYPDAQIYLDLKGTSRDPLSSADAMAHVIRSFNRETSVPRDEAALQGLYHSVLHGQRALLLMDNAADAQQVQPLVPPEGCTLLVTSRQRFDLPGLSAEARGNRTLLQESLESVGITNYPSEFWHWSFGDPGWAYRGGHSHAIYGETRPDGWGLHPEDAEDGPLPLMDAPDQAD